MNCRPLLDFRTMSTIRWLLERHRDRALQHKVVSQIIRLSINLRRDRTVCRVQVILRFKKCHEEHPVAKFWGACNELKYELDNCFRNEV